MKLISNNHCAAAVKVERRVPVTINPGTQQERVIYMRETLYNRIKEALGKQNAETSHTAGTIAPAEGP